MADREEDVDPFESTRRRVIANRESDYHKKGRQARGELSPERVDAFAAATAKKNAEDTKNARSYGEILEEHAIDRETAELKRQYEDVQRKTDGEKPTRKRRWDITEPAPTAAAKPAAKPVSEWERDDEPAEKKAQPVRKRSRWDETPVAGPAAPANDDAGPRRSRWDETPVGAPGIGATPLVGATPAAGKSRWDETPVGMSGFAGATPMGNAAMTQMTPNPSTMMMTPSAGGDMSQMMRLERDIEMRNQPMTDEDIDAILPQTGYKILPAPASYRPIRTPARKLMATPTPMGGSGFFMQDGSAAAQLASQQQPVEIPADGKIGAMPHLKPEDMQYFGKLLEAKGEGEITPEEAKERKILRLLLKIKNGTPQMRKSSLKQITERARDFGAGPLFNQILPLLMSPTLEDQERHLLVKVIDRILYKLDDLVRPFVHKILVVIEPLLIDEDYYARVEGREIISNLSKAAGLATMISVMRPDIDHSDEYVRNTTSRAFAVVASALGIPALLPFLKAVCRSKKSWQARHTGIKIVQQIAILLGCAVLPHLKLLVECIGHGLADEQQKVRTVTSLSIAALAEAAAPYGIESFDSVLKPLWQGTRKHRGKGLAAILKAIGYIIPLMDAEYGSYYTRDVMPILIREFQTPDEEMKKIVLKVVKQCAATDGVTADYLRKELFDDYFNHFWVRRMALDKRNYRQLVETTVELANKTGASDVISRIVQGLKDEAESYRKMVMEAISAIITNLGASDIDLTLEEALIDGIIFSFQEQLGDEVEILNGFGAVVNALGLRVKPYLSQISSTILWRMNNKTAKVRQQAADLVSKIADVLQRCDEEAVLSHLGVVLYESLNEEYPEVLGSILGGLKAIVNVIGMTKMQPPIKDLLPRLTPILKNRHEKVQENCIDLVGRIADRGADHVGAREWMRVCFELLELLKAHKKAIRRAAVNTFGYIAKAIGPQDVLATLLNNLKVQERQNRVCTTVAIAIVAETCSPFTILPALMNEYRVPELNVQNGVLKSLSFLFEYIGEMGKDYIYAVTPLLEDALMDRDAVHRQTACATVKHMALGSASLGCEDALTHLLNLIWPNIFEQSPHVINAVMDAIEGLRIALGPAVIAEYTFQGLFHPARKIREVYWRIWNSCYIGHQDSMVAYFPRVGAVGRKQLAVQKGIAVLDDKGAPASLSETVYSRPELDILL